MLFNECIVSNYGKTCISNLRLFNILPVEKIFIYLITREAKNLLKMSIENLNLNFNGTFIDPSYIDINYISFS